MQASTTIPETYATPFAGGFYAGRIQIDGIAYALVVSPKDQGEIEMPWSDSAKRVVGAESHCDGAANTAAMAAAGSKLAQWALDLQIDGHTDWYLPSVDELEIIYRAMKPTTEENSLYGRSGVNASALPPTHPYSRTVPAQTADPAFQAGGVQAFEDEWYWSSTQHAFNSYYAWIQYFNYGIQNNIIKSASGRARAVRRLPI